MRVLYINPFSQQISGPDESLLALLRELVLLGVQPHVALPRPGPQVERYAALGAQVHYLPLTILKRRLSLTECLTLPARLIRSTLAVRRLARRERIQLIHTNMEVVLDGGIASRLLGLPHVLHYRGNTLDRPAWVFDVLAKLWSRTSDLVLCISRATAEVFWKRGITSSVEVMYNPVNVSRFRKCQRSEEVRASLRAGPSDRLIVAVGRIHPRKDLDTFLRAGALLVQRVPPVRLAIVGSAEGPAERAYQRSLEALAVELGIAPHVTWAGPRSDIPEVLKAADALVLSSRHEGFGRVVAEALASDLPVVGSAEGGIPELLEGGGGLTARACDPEDFAKAIQIALSTSPKASDDSVSRFAARAIAEAVLQKYERLLRARVPERESAVGNRSGP